MRLIQSMENPHHYGPISCMCLDRKRSWLVVGTYTGVLSLWDRRFGLLLKSWKCAAASKRAARIHQCVVHPSKGRGKWIIVAVENSDRTMSRSLTTLVEVWDVETGTLVETFATGTSFDVVEEAQEITGIDAETSPAAAIAAFVHSRQAADDRGLSPQGISNQNSSFPSAVD